MKVLIAGDLLPYDRVARLFESERYDTVFGQIRERIADADYAIVNFECPICRGDEKAIEKLGPSHKCTNSVIGAIKYAGFDCVTLANNHFRDFGDEGCLNTLRELDDNGIDHVGGGKNDREAAEILYREIDGKRLAVINCCEHEFSIACEQHAGSNALNPIGQYHAIKEAREKADFVVVIVHGGHEHYRLPSPRMVETYRFFVEAGADAVVNHHQHCFSGYEVYRGKPIFYGLGNFCFDKPVKRADMWNEGYLVELCLEEDESGFKVLPYIQCDDEPGVAAMCDDREEKFLSDLAAINAAIADGRILKEQFDNWCDKKGKSCEGTLVPYTGKLSRWLYYKGVLSSTLTKGRLIGLYDVARCESHYDVLIHYLEQKKK